jgi:cell division protein FtsI/penicillin-binding protein 2
MKNKDIFKKLVGLEGGDKKWHVATSKTVNSEKWIYHILPADAEAPNIEDDRKPNTFLVFLGIIMLAFVFLSGRLFSMQLLSGDKSLKQAENNRVRENVIRSPRGILFDSKGISLVKNVPNFDVTVIPSDLPRNTTEREGVEKTLSDIIGVSFDEIKSKVDSKENRYSTLPVMIAKNIDKDKSIIIESKLSGLVGVKVEVNPIRE